MATTAASEFCGFLSLPFVSIVVSFACLRNIIPRLSSVVLSAFLYFSVSFLLKQQPKYKMSSNSEKLTKAANRGDVAEVRRWIALKCSPDTYDGLFVCCMENACLWSMWKQHQQPHLLCFPETKTSGSPQPAGKCFLMFEVLKNQQVIFQPAASVVSVVEDVSKKVGL